MQDYRPPLRDMRFVLFELMQAETTWASLPATSEVNRELADAVLEESGRISAELIAPLLRSGDEEGVKFDAGVVTTPAGYKEAWRQFAEGGWVGLTGNPEYGGQGMPKLLAAAVEEMLVSAGSAFGLYAILSSGACLLLDAHASDEQKQRYIPPIYRGDWAGVMCLTEPHAGSDLGLIRTRAEPVGDGSYRITGNKIFITGGEQDLTDNIIHLVLARLPDAPAGTKGISLFIVPKRLVEADGSPGARNAVACGSIEHKMGIHAASTCVMNFDGATGWLIGEPGKGLNYMFTMMNYERVTVGLQGLGCAERAFQVSLAYARERLQGRAPSSTSGTGADPIIMHADVRRMLLTQKALVEAGRAFAAHVGLQLDLAKHASGEAQQRAAAQVALLTPVTKAFLTDKGLEGCLAGQMVFGGHGYIREWGVEQLVRDVRISQIYEGTNGIQALDLLGRKVVADGGRALAALFTEVSGWIDGARTEPAMAEFLEPLERAVAAFERLTRQLMHGVAADPDLISASAVDYLHAFGLTLYAWLWARMAQLALAHTSDDDGFYAAKLETARFYMQRLLPQLYGHCEAAQAGSKALMALPAERFAY